MFAYCTKCKSNQEVINPEFIERTENVRCRRLIGHCIECNKLITCFLKNDPTILME